jgi:hypothetical protein
MKKEETHFLPRRLETPHTKDSHNKPAETLFLKSRTLPRQPKDRREKAEVKITFENKYENKRKQ